MTRKKFTKGKRFELILKGQSLKIIENLSEGERSQFIREAIQYYSDYLRHTKHLVDFMTPEEAKDLWEQLEKKKLKEKKMMEKMIEENAPAKHLFTERSIEE